MIAAEMACRDHMHRREAVARHNAAERSTAARDIGNAGGAGIARRNREIGSAERHIDQHHARALACQRPRESKRRRGRAGIARGSDHGHPPGGTTLAGERALFERVKTAIPQQTALYTEYCPPDIIAPYLDGAYMHALRLARPEVSPGYLNTSRFSFPDLRLFQITNGGSCYDGIWDGFYFTLFNGMRIYSLAWGHDDEAFVLLRRIRELYGEHGEAFCDPAPRPLVATLAAGLYANEFSSAKETVWTIWNDRYRTYTGDVLSVPHPAGAGYRDAWNKVDLKPRTAGGRAVLPITIGPREIGVLVQRR